MARRKPPGKPPSVKRREREEKERGPYFALRAFASAHVQAARQQGIAPEEARSYILDLLRKAWEGGPPKREEMQVVDGREVMAPRAAFALALTKYGLDRRDEQTYETAAAIVGREIEREQSDTGYTNRPEYDDAKTF